MQRPDPNDQGNVKAAEHSDADELRAEQALVAAAERLLRSTAPGVPENFIACLFARALPETSCGMIRASLPRSQRMPGRCSPCAPPARRSFVWRPLPARPAPSASAATRVLEIVNDDMPFLLDSVLGELAERGTDRSLRCASRVQRRPRRCGTASDVQGDATAQKERCAKASSTSI